MRKLIVLSLLCCSLAWGDTLTLKDGTTHQGTLQSTTSRYVVFKEGGMPHRYLRSNVESITFSPNGTEANYNQNRYGQNSYNNNYSAQNRPYYNGPNGMTVPAGTQIAVRTDQNINSKTANEGQLYPAEVQENVYDSAGNVVIPKGSQAELAIRRVTTAGTVTGSNDLALGLRSVRVNGTSYRVSTETVQQQGNAGIGKNKRTAEMVGGGALLGTLVGAIAGGGKGAAIGAIAGAGAGAGAQVLTRGKEVKVPAETTLRFQLQQPLHLRRE